MSKISGSRPRPRVAKGRKVIPTGSTGTGASYASVGGSKLPHGARPRPRVARDKMPRK